MDKLHIEESKATGRLVLGKDDDPYDYTVPRVRGGWKGLTLYTLFVAACVYYGLRHNSPEGLAAFVLISLLFLGEFLYKRTCYHRSLRLTPIATTLPRPEISARVTALARERGWEILTDQPDQIIIQTAPDRVPYDGDERVTLLFAPGVVHANSLAATGTIRQCRDGRRRNARNIDLLTAALAG